MTRKVEFPKGITLLEKARLYRNFNNGSEGKGKKFSVEEIELAIAWAKDEITSAQVSRAARNGSNKVWGGLHCFLCSALREAVRREQFGSEDPYY